MDMAVSDNHSNLYSYYRAIGCISNHVPYAIQVKGGEHFIITSIGRTFHVYNVRFHYFFDLSLMYLQQSSNY